MSGDIKDYVQKCDRCQRNNDKFRKPSAILHPIPIEPEVWQQVDFIYKFYFMCILNTVNSM